ncbi:MAG: response regulator [Alphaproteobacteria bacterium]|nr:response regulator [Alphaproteobacteria bacterium]
MTVKDRSGKRALVADADIGVRDTIFEGLEIAGFDQIDEVADGSDALKALDRNRYDLIISDVRLHGMSGFEFVEVLRNPRLIRYDLHKSRTPVMFVSESQQTRDIQRAKELGGKGYFLKPFTALDLSARLMKLYGK